LDTLGMATIQGNTVVGENNGIAAYGSATIGGTVTGAGNTISGNTYKGISLHSSATVLGNSISGSSYGVWVDGGNGGGTAVIGGAVAGARNVISNNWTAGIAITRVGIATVTGNSFSGNGDGIEVGGAATIGGTAKGAGNTFSNNFYASIAGGGTATILGNSVMGSQFGIAALGVNVTIGGTVAGAGNTVSGSTECAVQTDGEVEIQGNSISGAPVIGIRVDGGSVTIGGSTAAARNSITGSSGEGIFLDNGSAATITGNAITGNGTGILVAGAADTCLVTAQNNDLSDNTTAGVINEQTAATYAVNASFDWWGSATGPTTPANPGGTGTSVSSNVTFAPWLGNAKIVAPDYFVFPILTGDLYAVSPASGDTQLYVALDGNVVALIRGGDSVGFAGNGGTIYVIGESGSGTADVFSLSNGLVEFRAKDGLANSKSTS
jgi:parallel beta-helix repeat protein